MYKYLYIPVNPENLSGCITELNFIAFSSKSLNNCPITVIKDWQPKLTELNFVKVTGDFPENMTEILGFDCIVTDEDDIKQVYPMADYIKLTTVKRGFNSKVGKTLLQLRHLICHTDNCTNLVTSIPAGETLSIYHRCNSCNQPVSIGN